MPWGQPAIPKEPDGPPPNRPQHRGLAQKRVSAASSSAGGPAGSEEEEEYEQQQQQSKAEYACKHCNKKMSRTNKDRMKKHIINVNVCGFLSSTAASAAAAAAGAKGAQQIAEPYRPQ
eukprot:1158813-Pelagomonas_calceolata.AAC.4